MSLAERIGKIIAGMLVAAIVLVAGGLALFVIGFFLALGASYGWS